MEKRLRNWTKNALLEEDENRPFLLKCRINSGIIYAYSSNRCVGVLHDFYPTHKELEEYLDYLKSISFSIRKRKSKNLLVSFEAKYKPPRRNKEIPFHEEKER